MKPRTTLAQLLELNIDRAKARRVLEGIADGRFVELPVLGRPLTTIARRAPAESFELHVEVDHAGLRVWALMLGAGADAFDLEREPVSPDRYTLRVRSAAPAPRFLAWLLCERIAPAPRGSRPQG